MPHIIVKIATETTPEQKAQLAARLVQAVTQTLGHTPDVVSVAMETHTTGTWMDEVYTPDIEGKQDSLLIRPGYGPLAS